MVLDPLGCDGWLVGLFLLERAALGRDPVQFQPQGPAAADAVAGEFGFGQVPAQVTVEFPVGAVAWIALAGAPHRQGGAAVAAEEGRPRRRADRRKHPIAGAGQGMQQPVAIEHRIAQAAGQQLLV